MPQNAKVPDMFLMKLRDNDGDRTMKNYYVETAREAEAMVIRMWPEVKIDQEGNAYVEVWKELTLATHEQVKRKFNLIVATIGFQDKV